MNRYYVKTGKFGQYFFDKKHLKAMSLEEVLKKNKQGR